MKLDPHPKFWATVKVRHPGEDGLTEEFRARYRALTVDEFTNHDLTTGAGTEAFLRDVLIDFDDLQDVDGRALAFGDSTLLALMAPPHVRLALVRTYETAIREAARGN